MHSKEKLFKFKNPTYVTNPMKKIDDIKNK